MPTIKIGRRTVAAIQKPERPTFYWDEDLHGFGLLVHPSGSRTWIVQYRAGAGGRGASSRRITLGPVNDAIPPEKARDKAKTVLAKVRLGADPAAERAEERKAETVQEIMAAWLRRHVEAKRKGSTAALYRQIIDTHIVPALGTKRALAVTKQEVARLHEAIATKERKKRKAEAKPRASRETLRGGTYVANRVLALLSASFNWAAEAGLLPHGHRNPALGIEKFREHARERFLSSEEMARLGTALREAETTGIPWEIDESKPTAKHVPKRNRVTVLPSHVVAAFHLLIFSGARLREILNLRWADVDLERGALFLPDSKTGRKTVLLSPQAVEILESLPRVGSFVVASESAGTTDERPRHDLKKPWAIVTRRAGLCGLRIHDLRHSFASFAVGLGEARVELESDASLTKRQLSWLSCWLTKGQWIVPEAAALLSGFLPPDLSDPSDTELLGPWLPGRKPWEHERESWEWMVQREYTHVRQWLTTISDLGAKRPAELIALAIEAELMPPWMRDLLSSKHEKLLPRNIRAKARAALGGEVVDPGTDLQSDAAFRKHFNKYPKWDREVREIAQPIKAGKKVAEINQNIGRDVRHLVARLRKGETVEEMTAGFRSWKRRTGKA